MKSKKFLNKNKPQKDDIWMVVEDGKLLPKNGYHEISNKLGNVIGKGFYKNGVRHGFWQFFFENGNMRSSGYYGKDGLRLSLKEYGDTWNYFDKDGKLLNFDDENISCELKNIFDEFNIQIANEIFEN